MTTNTDKALEPVLPELPKWVDDQKGKDPLMDDLIAYAEQMRTYALAAIEAGRKGRAADVTEGWISVDERLPENSADVQVYCPDTKEQFVAFHCGGGEFQYAMDRHGERIVCRPTHWMPIAAAPCGQQQNEEG